MEAVMRVAVEILDSHGRVHMRERLVLPADRPRFTVGRSASADVMIDDPHAAALHAALERAPDGRWLVSDLDSLNGVIVGGRRLAKVTDMPLPGDSLQIGRTRLRIRAETDTLAPEIADGDARDVLSSRTPLIAAAGALICVLFTGYFAWLAAPRDAATVVIGAVAALFVALSIWTAIWALLTRVIRGEPRWIHHAAVICGVGAVLLLLDWTLDLGWYVLSLPAISGRDALLAAAGLTAILYWHISVAVPMTPRKAFLWAVVAPILIIGTTSWVDARRHMRDVNFIGEPVTLYPPSLRLRSGTSLDAFFAAADKLKQDADRKRKAIRSDDGDNSEDTVDE